MYYFFFGRFSFGGITSLLADDDTWVSHTGKGSFSQRKPKPYCWECTIWISKGCAPTSIFCGITRESARGGKTDWWWIMYTFSKLWYLSGDVMLHMTNPNHHHEHVIVFRHSIIRHGFNMWQSTRFLQIAACCALQANCKIHLLSSFCIVLKYMLKKRLLSLGYNINSDAKL